MNVNEMSRSEVNEAIARLRDAWHYAAGPGGTTGPDYCHDWAACGPLWDEMPPGSTIIKHRAERKIAVSWPVEHNWHDDQQAEETPEAIARAYYAWRNADAEEPQP